MLPHDKQAEQLSQELDRYLLATSDHPQALTPEDEPELALGVQLLRSDFSRQSKLRARLRRNLEFERGIEFSSPAHQLLESATSRRRKHIFKIRNYWPALIAMAIILSVWFWTSATSSPDTPSLRPSPMVVVTAVLSASQQPAETDHLPVPTPLAPPSTRAYHPSYTAPVAQHTPFGLLVTSPQVNYP